MTIIHMIKVNQIITLSIVSSLLLGCVSQSYENNSDSPIIENSSTNNEIASTRISLAMGYLNMGNTTQAKINLEKAKRFAPNLTKVYTAYAHYYDVVDESEQAIAAFEKALSIDSKDADTLNNYGVFLCKEGLYNESEKKMLAAIAVSGYALVSKSYENLALCQLEAKKFDKAEMYLAKSISHSPSSSSALLKMLRLQYAMENYEQGEKYLRRYEKSTRRFTPNALALAFKLHQKQHKIRIANNYAGMLVKMFPNSYEAKQFLLNGLQHIEGDDLAKEYQLINNKVKRESKKKVMVLSPNKQSGISITPKVESINNIETKVQAESNDTELREKSGLLDKVNDQTDNVKPESTEVNEQVTENKNTILDNTALNLPIHIIKYGETLFRISAKYNIRVQTLQDWNELDDSSKLYVGDTIYLADPNKVL